MPSCLRAIAIAAVLGAAGTAFAQPGGFQMPDPKQMSGIPRPVTDLPDGTISVRLIRGSLSNNITGHDVQLQAGSKTLTSKTDAAGRAEFKGVPAGTPVKAVAVVDDERLESQEFPFPGQGGIRLMLVATDKDAEARKAREAAAPAVTGQVVIAGNSRIMLEPGDGDVQIYYLLEIVNTARGPVNPPSPFAFDMPKSAVGTTLLEGSSPKAAVSGTHVIVTGPFPPGTTTVQVAADFPFLGPTAEFSQRFPATMEQLAIVAKKAGAMRLTSPQLQTQREMQAEQDTYVVGTGPAIAAGHPVEVTLDNLPHHSTVPRWIALSLAVAIVIVGVFAVRRSPRNPSVAEEKKRLSARREKLFADLVRLETDHRAGRGDPVKYSARREELIAALVRIYSALDDPDDRAGLAA